MRSLIILVIVCGLQVAALALTCAEHWALPTTQQQHHSVPLEAADPPSHSSHSHADGTPHDHEQCSLVGVEHVVPLLLVAGLDCLCDASTSLAAVGVQLTERLAAVDDSYYERILLEIPSRPPIL